MALLRSILFVIVFYPGTAGAVLLSLVATPFGEAAVLRVGRDWARFHQWCARWLLGIRAQVEGDVPIGPVLVAAKHESMFETIELLVILADPAVVVKRELADLPGWGRVAQRYGVIPVDREGSGVALRRMIRAARAAVAADRSIVIFPEGTRVLPGERPPLRAGFAGLYRQLGLPVVPVAIDSGRLYPRHTLFKRPGTIRFRFGPPIPPGLPRAEIEQRVHMAINALNG